MMSDSCEGRPVVCFPRSTHHSTMNVVRWKGGKQRVLRSALGLLLVSVWLGGLARPGYAQTTTELLESTPQGTSVHPEAREAIGRLRSPYCPGLMLEVCGSSGGAMLRDSIQALAEGGMSADAIVEAVIAEYGEEWRAEPLTSGTGLWAWLLPPLFLGAGMAMVWATLKARRRRSSGGVGDREPPTEADLDRLSAAMARLEETERPDW